MKEFVSIIILILLLKSVTSEFPKDVPRCRHDELECIKNAITKVLQDFPNGHSGLNLPKIEPFHIDKLQINQGGNGPVSLDLILRNVTMRGLSKTKHSKIIGFTENPTKTMFETYANIPELIIEANYAIHGNILFLPIEGNGTTKNILNNVKIGMKIKPLMKTEDGKEYVQVQKIRVSLQPETTSYYFSNLFNGDDALGEIMNQFLNENSKEIWKESSPAINNATGEVIGSIFNAVFSKFPYHEFFLEK